MLKLFKMGKNIKILITLSRSLGDTIVIIPSLKNIREFFKDAEMDLVTSKLGFEFLKNCPYISNIYILERKNNLFYFFKYLILILKLRRKKYDLSFHFYASISECWLGFLSGIKKRAVYRHSMRRKDLFSTYPSVKKELKSVIERNFDLLKVTGIPVKEYSLEVYLNDKDKKEADDFLNVNNLSKYIIFAPHSGDLSKEWDIDKWVELKNILEEKGYKILWILDPKRTEEISGVFYKGDLNVAISLIERASFFIGLDSGLKHIAVAVSTPSLSLLEEDKVIEWHPYDTSIHQIITGRSIKEIKVSQVLDRLLPLLNQKNHVL